MEENIQRLNDGMQRLKERVSVLERTSGPLIMEVILGKLETVEARLKELDGAKTIRTSLP